MSDFYTDEIDETRFITTKQLAELWGVTEQHLINMRNKNKHPYVKIGGRVFYDLYEMTEMRRMQFFDPE